MLHMKKLINGLWIPANLFIRPLSDNSIEGKKTAAQQQPFLCIFVLGLGNSYFFAEWWVKKEKTNQMTFKLKYTKGFHHLETFWAKKTKHTGPQKTVWVTPKNKQKNSLLWWTVYNFTIVKLLLYGGKYIYIKFLILWIITWHFPRKIVLVN